MTKKQKSEAESEAPPAAEPEATEAPQTGEWGAPPLPDPLQPLLERWRDGRASALDMSEIQGILFARYLQPKSTIATAARVTKAPAAPAEPAE